MFSPMSAKRTGLFGAVVLSFVLGACASDSSSPTDPVRQADHTIGEPPELHAFAVCAVGVGADYEVVTTVLPAGAPTTTNMPIAAGACTRVAYSPLVKTVVKVTQLPAVNVQLDSIVKLSFILPAFTPPGPQKVVGSAVVTDTIHGDEGNVATFYNRTLAPSLVVDKQADQGTVAAGTNIGFTVTVTNNGPGVATGVTLSDPLPTGAGISWSESPDVAACSITAGVLNCSFGDMAAGATATVHVSSPTTEASCGTYNNTATADATNHDAVTASDGTTVECAPPTGNQGCTPGFWKQSQHFQFWTSPYTTSTLLKNVFSGATGYFTDKSNLPMGDQTMLQGLNFKGGSSIGGAAETLLRAGVAAVLNAANPDVDYAMSAASIVADVNSALASGNRATILGLAGRLDTFNNAGCTAK